MALDHETAKCIVDAVSADVSARRTIEASKLPAIVDKALESLRWAGGVRNAAMLLRGMGPENVEFVFHA